MKNPCMECPDVGCGPYHDECPKYQEFRNNNLKDYERRIQKSNEKYDIVENRRRHIRQASHYNKKP